MKSNVLLYVIIEYEAKFYLNVLLFFKKDDVVFSNDVNEYIGPLCLIFKGISDNTIIFMQWNHLDSLLLFFIIDVSIYLTIC